MKCLVLLVSALIAVAVAQRQQLQQQQQQKQDDSKYRNIQNIAQENVVEHDGSFTYGFENTDGTKASQNGQLRYVDQKNAGEAVQGGYSYTVSWTRSLGRASKNISLKSDHKVKKLFIDNKL